MHGLITAVSIYIPFRLIRCTVQTGDADETGSTYSSAYSSKSDSVTPVDSFSELSDGSLDERTSRQTSQVHACRVWLISIKS